jgi:hypothetical protein
VLPVDSFPTDESPYGVRNLAGNVRTFCLNSPGPAYPGWRLIAGAGWLTNGDPLRLCDRGGGIEYNVGNQVGGRLAWYPRTPLPKPEITFDAGTRTGNGPVPRR